MPKTLRPPSSPPSPRARTNIINARQTRVAPDTRKPIRPGNTIRTVLGEGENHLSTGEKKKKKFVNEMNSIIISVPGQINHR